MAALRPVFAAAAIVAAVFLPVITSADEEGISPGAAAAERRLTSLPPLITFTFSSTTSKAIVGTEATTCADDGSNVPAGAILGDVALFLTAYSGSCWSDGRYNNRDYQVEEGTISGNDGSSTTAYRINPHTTTHTQFRGSGVVLYFRTAQAQSGAKLYRFDETTGSFSYIGAFTTTAGVFLDSGLVVDQMTTAMTVVIDAAGDGRFSEWPLASNTVEAAWLAGNSDFTITARRFETASTNDPFVAETDWISGPGAHEANYAIPKKFFCVHSATQGEGVVWQDQTSGHIYQTFFAADLLSSTTTKIVDNPSPGHHLVAAVSNNVDHAILVTVSEENPCANSAPSTCKDASIDTSIIQVIMSEGRHDKWERPDTSKSGLNIHKFSTSGASIAWDTTNNKIGLVIARTMTKSNDGLNHQGAIAVVIDATTLAVTNNLGQSSGHSFANSLTLASDNSFLGMDLGDNYPRGVNTWRFKEDGWDGRHLVYEFKTKHRTDNGAGIGQNYEVYTEISDATTTYYKWSNDNNVYSELGHPGVLEVSDGLLVFFAGETPALDNSQVGQIMNTARNLGFVKVGKDLNSGTVLSGTNEETGGFYTFGGGWTAQSNTGVNWLTSYSTVDASVSRPKAVHVTTGVNFLYYEVWDRTSYNSTYVLTVDDTGAVQKGPMKIDHPVRLPIQDDFYVIDNDVVAYSGTSTGQIVRYSMCWQGASCTTMTTTMVTGPSGGATTTGATGTTGMMGMTGTTTTDTTTTVNGTEMPTQGSPAAAVISPLVVAGGTILALALAPRGA